MARSARGQWIGAIALSEPEAGSDLAGVSTVPSWTATSGW